MSEIIALLVSLEPYLSSTTRRQLHQVVFALLCIPKRATMLGLARWCEKGGSYRTIQRLYTSPIPWLQVKWTLLCLHLIKATGQYLLAGDEVVMNKAGQTTYGV